MKRYLYLLCFCILVVSSSTPISAQIGAEIKELKVLKGKLGAVWHVTYSPDGTRVAGTAWKGVGGVHVWDAATGALTALSPSAASTGASPLSVAITVQGNWFFVANNGASSLSAYSVNSVGKLNSATTSTVVLTGQPSAVLIR